MIKVDLIQPGPFHFLNHHNLKKKKKAQVRKTVVKREKFDWKGRKSYRALGISFQNEKTILKTIT